MLQYLIVNELIAILSSPPPKMCMISALDARVSNTGLLVVPLPDNRQLTVYGNRVATSSEGAMILPVPRGTRPIELVDLSQYPDMFEKLNETRYRTKGRSLDGSRQPMIEVVDLGSYRVSVVDEFKQFQNLNRAEFRLTDDILAFLSLYYSAGFSFIVCKLKSVGSAAGDSAGYSGTEASGTDASGTSVQYHPFGYRHDIVNGKMFIPTMHYHLDSEEKTHVDWDHSIYLWNSQMLTDSVQQFSLKCEQESNYIKKMTTELGLPVCRRLVRFKITNYHLNHDLLALPLVFRGRQAADGRSVLPEYVLTGNVVCDGGRCSRDRNVLEYGWHKDPSVDYCLDCFECVEDKTSFVMFTPKFQ